MKTHYKKAFSLLELLISMSIIISVFSLGFKGKRVLDQTINNIKAHTAVSNMCDFLSYSKFYYLYTVYLFFQYNYQKNISF